MRAGRAPSLVCIPPNGSRLLLRPLSQTRHSWARVLVTEDELDPGAVIDSVRGPGFGAVAAFLGATRDSSGGRAVTGLEYEAYRPMADRMLERVAGELAGRWDLGEVAISHRIGPVGVGEISLVVAVSAAHRAPAFEACAHAVDRIKQIVPIWKREHFEDGRVWVGTQDGREFDPLGEVRGALPGGAPAGPPPGP